MAKKAKKSKPKSVRRKAKPKARQKLAKKSKSSSQTIKAKGITYAAPPKDAVARPKSVTVQLEKTDYSTTPSFAPTIPAPTMESGERIGIVSRISVGTHSSGALVFLLLAAAGYWLSLVFVSKGQWLSFLFSLMVMIFCLDSFMTIMARRQEAKHPLELPGMQNLHQLSMHVFLLLGIVAIVFAIAFWLQGRWIMLLLSLGAAVVAFDNMIAAKKRHETH
jgi:hypothetical protein